MNENREGAIIEFIKENPGLSSREIYEELSLPSSYATLKRGLASLVDRKILAKTGRGRSTRYQIAPSYAIIYPIDVGTYYEKEIDERDIKEGFNFHLITQILPECSLFTASEQKKLDELQSRFAINISELSEAEYLKEIERLAIDLSWKSSQIEGNTYSLLETEQLLKEKETASGKTKEEAVMLLNHKEAIDFVLENPTYLTPLSVTRIEDIHRILTRDLGIKKNIRKRRVGISGTNYRPLDNEFQIREALSDMCNLVNCRESIFEQALLTLVLISYIQPFADGNKRTARIVSNALLMSHESCPLSFRTVNSIDYKKAVLIFYEQNNISPFKEIFVEQFEFAVNTYF